MVDKAKAREIETSLRALAIARLVTCLLPCFATLADLFDVLVFDFLEALLVFVVLAFEVFFVVWVADFFADVFVTALWSVCAAAKAGAVRPSAATRVQQEKMRYSMR
ncbi:hypothetical protein WAE56_11870 [Iodobacter sp. LRB]|uniref:hypothetical protein n=1 Tax=unclassified Iodobacter TaxID=235634 RepID=UPI00211E6ED0|nr:hypothetical protein [Iodobacter sp. BJB302]